MEKVIEVQNLSKQFGSVRAVDDISFEVRRGELFGFLGVNGAGKSTTINMLCTLYEKTGGTIRICGADIEKEPEKVRKKIGVVFQANTLDNYLTVKENLILQGALYEKDKKKIKNRLSEVAEILDIGTILNRRFQMLSGGQKRRCDIAKALMNVPEILFLDEPTTGLDPATRKKVWESVRLLQKEMRMTVFLTTHYMEEAAGANYICIMDSGKIVAEGTASELKDAYAKDTLRLYTKNTETVFEKSRYYHLHCIRQSNCVVFPLESTIDAIAILQKMDSLFEGFEVLQGNMDDVFLNVTGIKIEE